ncbi:MAG: hypothetical protein IJA30_04805 [Bacilli bacterium]|nr:hypothetical protein [Bacilli bacterium]
MNKKITIITIVVGLIILIAGIVLALNISDGTTSKKEDEVKQAAKRIMNGKITNVDERISKARTYEGLEVKDSIIYTDEKDAYLQAIIINPTDKKIEKKRVTIKFYKGKKELDVLECLIPAVDANGSITFECGQPVPGIIDATDFKITKAQEGL